MLILFPLIMGGTDRQTEHVYFTKLYGWHTVIGFLMPRLLSYPIIITSFGVRQICIKQSSL